MGGIKKDMRLLAAVLVALACWLWFTGCAAPATALAEIAEPKREQAHRPLLYIWSTDNCVPCQRFKADLKNHPFLAKLLWSCYQPAPVVYGSRGWQRGKAISLPQFWAPDSERRAVGYEGPEWLLGKLGISIPAQTKPDPERPPWKPTDIVAPDQPSEPRESEITGGNTPSTGIPLDELLDSIDDRVEKQVGGVRNDLRQEIGRLGERLSDDGQRSSDQMGRVLGLVQSLADRKARLANEADPRTGSRLKRLESTVEHFQAGKKLVESNAGLPWWMRVGRDALALSRVAATGANPALLGLSIGGSALGWWWNRRRKKKAKSSSGDEEAPLKEPFC